MRRPNDPGGPWSGRALSLLRRYRRATCERVAEELGVSPATVSAWHRAPRGGAPYPTAQRVEELADLLAVPVDCLRSLASARSFIREQQDERRTA